MTKAYGILCHRHFEQRNATMEECDNCLDCQNARQEERDRIQRDHTIDPTKPYGKHIGLTCKNHSNLRWSTKNIDYIGARSVFYWSHDLQECDCPISDLIVTSGEKG